MTITNMVQPVYYSPVYIHSNTAENNVLVSFLYILHPSLVFRPKIDFMS